MRRVDPNFSLMGTDCTCVTASGQSLVIVGHVKVPLKIQEFSWSWGILVSKKRRIQPILGVDFIAKAKLVLELGNGRCYFAFAPSVYINLIKDEAHPSCFETNSLSYRLPQVQMGNFHPDKKKN